MWLCCVGVVVLFLFHYQGDSPQSLPFPVVDRPCLVLVRHCRKKKGGAIISRSVTSCAGMTAYRVLLAQTRVGFLSGTREKLPSTPTTRIDFPKRRGLCKGYSGSHSSTIDLLHHGPTGHAWVGWSSDYHWLLEIWCLLQWA